MTINHIYKKIYITQHSCMLKSCKVKFFFKEVMSTTNVTTSFEEVISLHSSSVGKKLKIEPCVGWSLNILKRLKKIFEKEALSS